MAEAEFCANLGTLPTIIPEAIGITATPKKKESQIKISNNILSKVKCTKMVKNVDRIPKMVHNVSAFSMPLPS